MALTPLIRIPTLSQRQPFVDEERRLTNESLRTLNGILSQIAEAVNQLAALPEIQAALEAAQEAVIVAQGAAETAQAAADAAGTAASDAQAQTAAIAREAAISGSYIDPDGVLTASPSTITIAPHTRMYADGSSAPVSGGSVAATAPGDVNYVFYSDPARAGGTVTFVASTGAPVQTGDTHVVGAVNIPATGIVDGGSGPRRPGEVIP